MLVLCKFISGEVFKTFVVIISVYDANFPAVTAVIDVRYSDDMMNGNCPQAPQAVVRWILSRTLAIVFSLNSN
jgi:hypothetical protein